MSAVHTLADYAYVWRDQLDHSGQYVIGSLFVSIDRYEIILAEIRLDKIKGRWSVLTWDGKMKDCATFVGAQRTAERLTLAGDIAEQRGL